MGIKQEFRELYLATSDYDFRLFRTLRHLVSDPRTVIESASGDYTPPIRYAITLLSGIFLALWLIDNPGFFSSSGTQELWIFPARVQEHLRAVDRYQQNYAFLTLLILWVPVFLVLMKLFYWRIKSWSFFYRASLYFSATFFLPFPLLWGLSEWVNLPHVIHILSILLWAGLLFYQFVTLGLNAWYISLPKGAGILLGCMFFLGQFGPLLHKSAVHILTSQDIFYEVPSSGHLVEKRRQVPSYTHSHIEEAQMIGSQDAFLLTEQEIIRIDSSRISWKRPLSYTPSGMNRIPEHRLVLTHRARSDSTQRFDLVSYKGIHLGQFTIHNNSSPGRVYLLSASDSTFTLGIMGRELEILTLYTEDGRWRPKPPRTVAFNGEREPTSISKLSGNRGYLTAYATYSDRSLSSMGIVRVDSSFSELWSREVYRRNSPYLPIDMLEFKLNRRDSLLYTYYSLSNDTLVNAHVEAISLTDGGSLWSRIHSIPADVIDSPEIALGNRLLYFYGEAWKRITNNFWSPEYHIGMIGALDLDNGNMIGYRFFGPTRHGDHSRVEDIHLSNDLLHFLTLETHQATPLQAMVWEPDTLYFKSVSLQSLAFEQP